MATADKTVEALRGQLSGEVLGPADAAYEDARRVYNGMIDRHPALIARCRGAADVQAAVRFGREHGLEIAVRGGGHNVAGNAACDGGLVVDLSLMRGVHVDPRTRRARAQGGATWGDYNRETQLHGLASTGGVVSTTGIGGLTLGGGLGWLMGKHGLAVDNLRALEVVLASGDVVRASADEHADLFWATRGGGGNFGVATWFEYDVHPVGPLVVAGLAAHPFDRARDVLRFYRDFTASLPDELTAFGGLVHAPDGSGAKLAAVIVCHSGDLETGGKAVAPVKQFGSPVVDGIAPMPYSAVNMLFDAGFPRGALNYWKANFLAGLPDEAIETLIEQFAACPSPMSALFLEHFHGAATRVAATATAFPHREPGYNFLVVGEWTDPAASSANVGWVRKAYAAMAPHFAAGRYVNYLNVDDLKEQASVQAAFGPNATRLREVKRRYDPDNLFHLNQNVRP
ncbi:MAG TPA: FAD-binding oxidoreductase [Methylomirabilota bacterium]|nr:FAD-binding oxidoreductase [Methylomirabilota bacterium]